MFETTIFLEKWLDFRYFFVIHCIQRVFCAEKKCATVLRVWCNWCSIADFSSVCTGSSPVTRFLSFENCIIYYCFCNSMLKQIFAGLFISALWATLTYFSQGVTDMFWRIDWFERNLWSTRNGFVLFGFLIIVIGFLILFGVIPLWQSITEATPVL